MPFSPACKGFSLLAALALLYLLANAHMSHTYMAPCSFARAVHALYACFHTFAKEAVHRLKAIYLAVQHASLADLVYKALMMQSCGGKSQISCTLFKSCKVLCPAWVPEPRWGLMKENSLSKFLHVKTSLIIFI